MKACGIYLLQLDVTVKKFGDRLDLFYTQNLLNPQWQEHPMKPVRNQKGGYSMSHGWKTI